MTESLLLPVTLSCVKSSRLRCRDADILLGFLTTRCGRLLMRQRQESRWGGIVERLNSGDEFPIDGRRSSEGDPLMAYQSDNDLQNLYSTTDYAHHLAMSFAMDDPKRYKVASITSNGEHVHWVAHDQFTHELVDVYGRHSSVDDLTSGWEMFDEMRENGETIDMKRYDDPNDAQKLMTAGHEFFPPFWRDNADVVKERFNLSDSTKRLTAYQKEAQNASS